MEPDPGIFRALIERCPMVTYVCDAEGAITYISPQVEDWTGLPAHLWTEDPKFWYSTVHPDDLAHVQREVDSGRLLDVEYRMVGRGGSWRRVWEQEVSLPADEGSQGVVLDITALREAQEALQATQDRLGVLVNAAPVILFATDSAGTITVSEGKALESLGVPPGEMVGSSIFDYPDMPEVPGYARRALAGESFENRLQVGENS